MKKQYLKEYDTVYTTGAYLQIERGKWEIISFTKDTYYDGRLVKDIGTKPYIEIEE